jgi:hypothetical protein
VSDYGLHETADVMTLYRTKKGDNDARVGQAPGYAWRHPVYGVGKKNGFHP